MNHWRKRVFYEIFVHSFADGNNDGIGDFIGLRHKLDYLENLGVNALWLMPIHPSPSYHKYDVTDYFGIHPDYGTKEDFVAFIEEAHRRDIKVIIDLVLNHSSELHPWFQQAIHQPDSKFRDYYVWSADEKAMAKDPEWHWHKSPLESNKIPSHLSSEKYYGFFWHGMPDLNLANPDVQEEIMKIGTYWLEEMKVDGFRLDAVKFFFREDQQAENHAFVKVFGDQMRSVNPDVFLVGEVWDSSAVIAPFLQGLNACFNFDLSFALHKVLAKGKGLEEIGQVLPLAYENYHYHNKDFMDAIFLTNHDQDRIASLLKDRTGRVKLAASILLLLPGIPFIYYGEEIGMKGKKPDEGIREPMVWDRRGSDPLQCTWAELKWNHEKKTIPAAIQLQDSGSIYSHYKNLIQIRKKMPTLALGEIRFFDQGDKILAYGLDYQDESILLLHNLGRTSRKLPLPTGFSEIIFSTMSRTLVSGRYISLPGFGSVILR